MSASAVIPEIQELAQRGSAQRRGEIIGQIADLLMAGASDFNDDHVAVFDQALLGLVSETEVRVRALLSEKLAPIPNAPRGIVGKLARDTEIKVAAPVLRQSPLLDDATLVEIARAHDQEHLFALASRASLPEPVTDVIVRRGAREVVRQVAVNNGAKFSTSGFAGLIKRANDDGALALAVGQRQDLSAPHLQHLVTGAVDLVRRRLMANATPDRRAAIAAIIGEASGMSQAKPATRNFVAAQRVVLELHVAGQLDEAALAAFAKERKYEETAAALSAMTGVPLVVVDRLLSGEKADPIAILGKSIGLAWPTVRAVMVLRLGPGRTPSIPDLARAQLAFDQLPSSTAQRVVKFWQTRR